MNYLIMIRGTTDKQMRFLKMLNSVQIKKKIKDIKGCGCDGDVMVSPLIRPITLFDVSIGDSCADELNDVLSDYHSNPPASAIIGNAMRIIPKMKKFVANHAAPQTQWDMEDMHTNLAVHVLGQKTDKSGSQPTGICGQCGKNETEVWG